MNKLLTIFGLTLLLPILSFSTNTISNNKSSRGILSSNTIPRFVNKDELGGAYVIKPANKKDFCLDINGGFVSKSDNNAPDIIVYNSSSPTQANQRFEFRYLETNQGIDVFYITSSYDREGRFDVYNSSFIKGNKVWFYNHGNSDSKSNFAQRWIIQKNNNKTYRIINANYSNYFLSYDSNNKLIITNDDNDINSYWLLENICGDYGVNTSLYIADLDNGYVFNDDNKVERFLKPKDSKGSLSSILNVGVHGDNIQKTTYKNVEAYAVNYGSKFYIDTSFVYANEAYGDWSVNKVIGTDQCSDGNVRDWKICDDSYDFYLPNDENPYRVHQGSLIIEKSHDNKKWEKYKIYNFQSGLQNDTLTIDGNDDELIKTGVYLRISFAFEIYSDWSELLWGWLWEVNHPFNYKNIIEVSDPFFVSVDGFGDDEEEFGSLTIKNLTNTSSNNQDEGFSEQMQVAYTLTHNSLTTTGFYISSLFNAYKVEISQDYDYFYTEVKLNKNSVTNTFDSKSFLENGRYDIKVTTKFDKERIITIFVNKEDAIGTYFGTTFANNVLEEAFIEGQRILTGEDVQSLFSFDSLARYEVPVYKAGATVHIFSSPLICPLIGLLTYIGEDSRIIDIDTRYKSFDMVLEEPGEYYAYLKTIGKSGDVLTFNFHWWIIENAPGPQINNYLLKYKTQETHDLIPAYYAVQVDGDRYVFNDESGNVVEKNSVIYFAFASYESALDFALRVEKEYSLKEDNGQYSYQHADDPQELFENDYLLFKEMKQKAKEKVKKRYFSANNPYSLRLFTICDKYGNPQKDTIGNEITAYCLDVGTNYCIVTTDRSELAALTSRQPYINGFKFIKDEYGLDSSEIVLIDENNQIYEIEYDQDVEEQLIAQGAKTGKYIVRETNTFDDVNEYEVYYIEKDSINDTVLTVNIDGELTEINFADDSNTFRCHSFDIVSCKNKNDDHTLLLIKNEKVNSYDGSLVDHLSLFEIGTYQIISEDRLGNSFGITLIVE